MSSGKSKRIGRILKLDMFCQRIVQIINKLNVLLFKLEEPCKVCMSPLKHNQFQRKFPTLISFLGNFVRLISSQFPAACSYTWHGDGIIGRKAVIVEDSSFQEEYGHRWALSWMEEYLCPQRLSRKHCQAGEGLN